MSERSACAAPAWSGGEVRRFPRRLFRWRRRQSWEEAVEAGGSPRSGRRLEAAHRVPARINDLTRRRSLAAWVAWVGGDPGVRGPAGGPEGRSLPRLSEEKAEERESQRRSRGARGGKGSSGPGRASPQQGGGSPGVDSGLRRQRRLEESSCVVGDARVSGGPGPLSRGGNSHAGLTGALAAGRLRFGFAAAAALLAEGTWDT